MLKSVCCAIFLAIAVLLACSSPTPTPAPTDRSVPPPTLAPTPAPAATPAPTEEAPKSASVSGALAPLDMKDPDAFMSELSGAEQACVSDNSDPRRLMALMSAPELVSSEETAKLIQCLGDETLLRLFLTGLIGQTGPLDRGDFKVRPQRIRGL